MRTDYKNTGWAIKTNTFLCVSYVPSLVFDTDQKSAKVAKEAPYSPISNGAPQFVRHDPPCPAKTDKRNSKVADQTFDDQVIVIEAVAFWRVSQDGNRH